MESIWSASTDIKERATLKGDISADAAVIGGGLAGVLTAYYLTNRGIETVLLEANRLGSGQTKNTTAKITAQHELIYDRLIGDFGVQKARQYADANTQAINEYRRLIMDKNIDCDFADCSAYLYTKEDTTPLERELDAALKLGFDAEITTQTELPFPVKGALRYGGQAQFNPMKFLGEVSRELTVYEHTKVKKVEENLITTDEGSVKAKYIIFAAHFPFINIPGYYWVRMHQGRSYVLALENAAKMNGMYLGIDPDGLSFRNYGDITLLGGGGHRTGENKEGGQYKKLRREAKKLWPESQELRHWSAQDCMTPDSVPYIGRYSRSRPDWYVCTGFGKWGMTNSMVAAQLISRKIVGVKFPSAPVFSPQRHTTPPAAKSIGKNALKAVKGLGKGVFDLPKESIKDLPNGHGGIVEYDGMKYGVYKDDEGKSYIVKITCPHLGCMLEWYPDEKSWDCRCHGSRFDIFGKLIDNPAQEDIENWIRP
ncbi:MAG: FAD-dependent oxidoreductase [Oscillospiraceae bacterium]